MRETNNSIINVTNPIGVFDSGMGGLTVLKALKKTLPTESFIYLGDTARLPYGTKSVTTVRQYALQMARVLIEQQVKALVIACNTATTAALNHLKVMLPDIPVMGVIAPGAKAAVNMTQNNKIAVLATETTIQSFAYQNEISNHLPDALIKTRACSVLVALAEEGMVDNNVTKEALQHYLESFEDEDTILLGCTHFPVFKTAISRLVAKNVNIVDSADCAADALFEMLQSKSLLNVTNVDNISNMKSAGQIKYLVTDSIKRFQDVGEIFLGEDLKDGDIELIDINCK